MEGASCSQYAGAAIMERSQLKTVLICLGPAVDEEELVIVVTAGFTQPLSQFHLQGIDHRVAVETEGLQLPCHHLYIMGMRMTDTYNGMAAIEVEVLLPFVVPHLAASTFNDTNVE